MDLQKYTVYALPFGIIIGSIIAGFLIEKIIFAVIRKRIKGETSSMNARIATDAMKGIIMLLCVLAGIYIATDTISMSVTMQDYFKKASVVIIIFFVTFVVVRIVVGFITLYSKRNEGVLPSASILINLTKLLVYILGFLVILDKLGISITPILTALGIGGLAVALALQTTLSDFFAGLYIIASGLIKVGNYVQLDTGHEGYVTDITWRNTTIRLLANNLVIIPNSKLSSSILTNYSLPAKDLAVLVNIGVAYESDLEKVEKVTCEVAMQVMQEVQGGVPEFKPFIRYNEFGDSSINFTVILRGNEFIDQYLIKHEFIKRISKRYAKEGINIPFPIRTLYMHDK